MDYLYAFAISASGMNVERTRVDVSATNLANANTVQAPGSSGFQPMRVVAQAAAFGSLVSEGMAAAVMPSVTLEPLRSAPRLVHEPGHPFADAKGFVAYAPVDPATEMVTLMGAMRSYEANVAAMNTSRSLALKTLEIGRGS
jgi:flagellar basal-body rod protein FlgC